MDQSLVLGGNALKLDAQTVFPVLQLPEILNDADNPGNLPFFGLVIGAPQKISVEEHVDLGTCRQKNSALQGAAADAEVHQLGR